MSEEARRDNESSYQAPTSSSLTRRQLLVGGTSLLAIHASASLSGVQADERRELIDPTRLPGTSPRPYGERAPFEKQTRIATTTSSTTPLQDLHGIITPSALHFERHHNGVPAIDPAHHRLLIHGLTERPIIFTLEELMRFPSTSRIVFMECSGNSRDGWGEARDTTVQVLHGLTSTSEWTGVKLATLLESALMRQEATWMLAEGGDAAVLARSVPLTDDVLNEAMVCYGQNGEALRPEQGYPLRLLLPGLEGNINVKWLRRLKLGSTPFMTRWETSKYTDLMPNGKAYQFTLVMDAKSVITKPSGQQQLHPGLHEIQGLAWSGRGAITTVEVSVDAGKTWRAARLQEPVLPKCHTRFRLPWRWDGQETVIQSRCTDDTGYCQPTRESLIAVRGTQSSYHYNGIQSWKVERSGMVKNVYA